MKFGPEKRLETIRDLMAHLYKRAEELQQQADELNTKMERLRVEERDLEFQIRSRAMNERRFQPIKILKN